MTILRVFQVLAICLWAMAFSFNAFAATPEKLFAVVSKVEGNGTARVRRMAGTESVVGQQMEIYAGDRIFTDDTSVVEMVLHDGTLIRVGIRSEFKLEEVQQKNGMLTWVFGLAGGTIRALIEKSPNSKTVKMRVNTPAGTMGVRGTEITLEHKRESGITTLFTLEGKVEFGALECKKLNSCVEITEGKFSSIKIGDKKPSIPAATALKDLLGLGAAANGSNKENITVDRLALFQGLSHSNAGMLSGMSEAELAKTVRAAQDQLQAAQDKLLGRSAETRRAMYAAMKEGTYEQFLTIADAYVSAKGGRGGLTETEASNQGALGAEKFALGRSIVEGKVFSENKDSSTAAATHSAVNSNAKVALAAAYLSDVDIAALISKNSESLAKATTWAKSIPVKTVYPSTDTSTATNTELSYNTASNSSLIRSLSKSPVVEQQYGVYENMVGATNSMLSPVCDFLCSIEKFFVAYSSSSWAQSTQTRTSTSTALGATALCSNPVTTCLYAPCDTRKGKICKQAPPVCKKTCK